MAFDVTEVQQALKGISYPASPDDLASTAEGNGADAELVSALRDLDGEASGPDQVMAKMKGSLGSD